MRGCALLLAALAVTLLWCCGGPGAAQHLTAAGGPSDSQGAADQPGDVGGDGGTGALAAAATPGNSRRFQSHLHHMEHSGKTWRQDQQQARQRRQLQAGGTAAAARCPALSRALLQGVARHNTLMLAVANSAQWDFALNWLQHVKAAGIGYYALAAADEATSRQLAAAGEPCFERIDEDIPALGLAWGQEGWRRMTWSKVFLLDAVVDWGFNLIMSDVDTVWFKDPLPLLGKHPQADLIFSEDGVSSSNDPGDDGLEVGGNVHSNFNTGVYLMRYSNRTAAWAHAWRQYYGQCRQHDQDCAYQLMRTPNVVRHPDVERVHSAWNGGVWMGILPPSIAMNAHSLFLQLLHKVKRVEPYVVHMTWSYNGIAGKRSRLRDLGLWVDPPQYYGVGSFVTVDLQLPEAPPGYNEWNENEDMISFHLDTIHKQLQQAYVGLALAAAASRAFILPTFMCYCEKIWYGVVRCRVVDAQSMPLPVPCPQDYLFDPAHYDDAPADFGPPLSIREASFLQNERTPEAVKGSVVTIQPSAALNCSQCVRQQPGPRGPLLLVSPGLTDAQLLPLLEPYQRYRVWKLSFEGVGSTSRAYAGFEDAAAAVAFDKRAEHVTTDFCCRREEEAPRYHKQEEMSVLLSLTSEFRYSDGNSSKGQASS